MTTSVKLNIPIKGAISTLTHHLNILQKERQDFEFAWRITGEPGLQYYVFLLNAPNDPALKTYCEIRLREMDAAKTDLTVFDPEWASFPPYMVFRSSLKKEDLAYLEKTKKYDVRADEFEEYVHSFIKRRDMIISALIKRLKSDGVLENNIQKETNKPSSINEGGTIFVAKAKLVQLKKIKSEQYDLKKLIRLCEELNYAYIGKCYLAVALLLRAIIDYVPPIFDKPGFPQVVSEYNWSTRSKPKKTPSAQKMMKRLDDSLRDLADYQIHFQAHKKQSLVDKVQVDFRSEFGVLLDEVIYLLKK